MERIEHLLRLTHADGLGPATINALLRQFGDAERVLAASVVELSRVPRVTEEVARAIQAARDFDPRPEMDRAARRGVRLLAYDDEEYPASLMVLRDPPPILYCMGTFAPADRAGFAIVGTRAPSAYGLRQARRFGSLAARAGFTVVSGLARGVDTCAHQGALDAGGRTIAVMGRGLSDIYPEENRDLAAEIAGRGVLVSEFPMDLEPGRDTFPRRNRLIAALSWGTLVVEAPTRSGALITAKVAVDLGREVFAVPGRVDEPNSAGCHKLLREGANLAADLDDLLAALPPTAEIRRPETTAGTKPKTAGDSPAKAKTPDKTKSAGNRAERRPGSGKAGQSVAEAVVAVDTPEASPRDDKDESDETWRAKRLRPRPPSAPRTAVAPARRSADNGAESAAVSDAGGDDQERVYAALTETPTPIDELVARTGLPVATVSRTLVLLELSRRAAIHPGMRYARR